MGTTRLITRWLFSMAMLALPMAVQAQEATISGKVTDTSGAVLPGVTVQALHEATGNNFETVTDSAGTYRLPVRIGTYQLTAQLPGFATITRRLQLLVGQEAVLDLQLAVSGVQETVTVAAEAPLVDVASSSLAGNIDARQTQELPLNGRNWTNLAMLAPGSRSTSMGDDVVPGHGDQDDKGYQINVDGQQVTQTHVAAAGFGQPRYSRDAIAEFEFVSNRFDARQGRSTGSQVNAVTKSGTNAFAGTLSGFFRHDRVNAADHVAGRVLPYQNQQVAGTFGGPILRDRFHFFAYSEYEREPSTIVYQTPYPSFNADLANIRTEKQVGGRTDIQFAASTRLSVRGSWWHNRMPYAGAGSTTSTPASQTSRVFKAPQVNASLVQVLSNRAVNEVRGGVTRFYWQYASIVKYGPNPFYPTEEVGAPRIRLRGLTIGPGTFPNQWAQQDMRSIRDDFTISFNGRGLHNVKTGGEYIHGVNQGLTCMVCFGDLDARGGAIPANIETLFPNLLDYSTWNLAPLSPLSANFRQGIGNGRFYNPRHIIGAWLQDDWSVTDDVTVNLGVRYDVLVNAFMQDIGIEPFLPANRPEDLNNLQPRLGFAWAMDEDRTVVRGGWGLYFGEIQTPQFTQLWTQVVSPLTLNDGRANFASDPFNGRTPTFDELVARGTPRETAAGELTGPDSRLPYAHQASFGVQRQLGRSMAVEADVTFQGIRNDNSLQNINLTYNPATGANYPFSDASRRPFPNWGLVAMNPRLARGNHRALQTAFHKRFSNRWQGSATYTLSEWEHSSGKYVEIINGAITPIPFELQPDLNGEYGLGESDQRHRAVLNGIWEIAGGLQLSGIYFYGSGMRLETVCGCGDLRNTAGDTDRLRPDGTLVPRNAFVSDPIHRVDMRLRQRVTLGRVSVDGLFEVFNLFNRANYGSYTTQESSPAYGQPSVNTNLAYSPRMAQLGFRVAF